MHTDFYLKAVLTVIAAALVALALRPAPVAAQASSSDLYIEPGYTMLRKPDGTMQAKGKVVIDLRSGGVWGFPTLADSPYPIDATNTKPPVSQPVYLGTFDFTAMRR